MGLFSSFHTHEGGLFIPDLATALSTHTSLGWKRGIITASSVGEKTSMGIDFHRLSYIHTALSDMYLAAEWGFCVVKMSGHLQNETTLGTASFDSG